MPITQILLTATTAQGGGGGGGGASYPLPGGGAYLSEWPNSAGWSTQGMATDPGSAVGNVGNPTAGWFRKTNVGVWSNGGANDNPSVFDNNLVSTTADGFGGFGSIDTGFDNYAMEWQGYFVPSATGVYNFLLDSDDVAMFWIGDGALDPQGINPWCVSNNGSQLNPNSASLTQNLAYPIRMRFQEWSGAERCQLFVGQVGTGTPLYAMNAWPFNMLHNSGTSGYNV